MTTLIIPAPAEFKVSLDDYPEKVNTGSCTVMSSITSHAANARIPYPEIHFPISLLSRVMHKLQKKHVADALRIIHYFYNNRDAGITFRNMDCAVWHSISIEHPCGVCRQQLRWIRTGCVLSLAHWLGHHVESGMACPSAQSRFFRRSRLIDLAMLRRWRRTVL